MAIGIGTIATGNMVGAGAGIGLGTSTNYKPGDIIKSITNRPATTEKTPDLFDVLKTGLMRESYAKYYNIENNEESIKNHYLEANKNNDFIPFSEKTEEKNEEESKTPLPPTPNGTEQESTGAPTPEEEQQGNVDNEFQQMLELANQEKYENWEREDKIRKETQEREDNAFQRMVKDMRLAGINPNLINATPSASGGGITNATQRESIIGNEIATISNELINAIKNDTTVSNNWKDNAFKTVQSFISLIGSYLIGKSLKSK